MVLLPQIGINIVGGVLALFFAFLFVTVSARITGQIGSSANPVSGMTVATLLLTSLMFLAAGWVGIEHRVLALSIGGVVCVAASTAGATSQDLKTGFLVGATPRYQQIGLLIGVTASALLVGGIIQFLNDAKTTIVPQELSRRAGVGDRAGRTVRPRERSSRPGTARPRPRRAIASAGCTSRLATRSRASTSSTTRARSSTSSIPGWAAASG